MSAPYVLVRWSGRTTDVLLVNADSTVTLIRSGVTADDVEHLRDLYPSLPFDVRPGAFRDEPVEGVTS
jgi:hypothetical protein